MDKIFIKIYFLFRKCRPLFWSLMLSSVAVFAVIASGIRLEENITSFFPSSGNTDNMSEVFSNLKVSDKIVIMFSPSGGRSIDPDSRDSLFAASDRFGGLVAGASRKYIGEMGGDDMTEMISFLETHLPLFMDDADYAHLAELDSPEAVDSAVRQDFVNLVSPAGFAMKDFILSDPLSIGGRVLARSAELNPASDYEVRDAHVFTPDGNTVMAFLEPAYASGNTGDNDSLISAVDSAVDSLSAEFPTVDVHYFGGPAMSVYNARQIKRDTYATSAVALLVIMAFILCVFKRRRSIFLILCPVAYGALFALACSRLIQGSISGIAVGAGTAIMGIALSYSIHFLAHQNYVKSVPQLLAELCSPLIIGGTTTVGAFVGLLFTSSALLQDFGLFASLTLVGTMLFCLLFLPQFLEGQADLKEGRVLKFIDRLSSYPFEKNRWLISALLAATAVCGYMSTRVGFDSDMMDLTYWDPQLKEAESLLSSFSSDTSGTVMFVNVGATGDEAYGAMKRTMSVLDSLRKKDLVLDYSDGGAFISGPEEQMRRIRKWQEWWTPERMERLSGELRSSAVKYGFREDSFDGFLSGLSSGCAPVDWFSDSSVPEAFRSWTGSSAAMKMLICRVTLREKNIEDVYSCFSGRDDVVIFDRSYFAGKAAESINRDFYLILFISSFLIFFVLWLSYGRLELALLSFLPMAVSWIIITGIMGILGVQFNIVNIILSTFIFGMGDDFSIFILEGLLHKYRTGEELVGPHKAAVFFSSFVMVAGIGALVFARHPALHSIAVITILGMAAVVLVAYVAEPVIFNAFVTRPASSGRAPYTFSNVLGPLFLYYVPAFCGGALILLAGFLLQLLPLGRGRRQEAISDLLHHSCRFLVRICPFIKSRLTDTAGNPAERWHGCGAIVTANHQSSLDAVLLMAVFPRIKFMVADRVRNSPLFYMISGMLGYYCKSDGFSGPEMERRVAEDIASGWVIAVFPEGTRTVDGNMRRFHKGAFQMAYSLDIPLIPVVFYGNWRICPKGNGLNMMKGTSVTCVMPPVKPSAFGDSAALRKSVKSSMQAVYGELCMKYDSPANPYFRGALISSYIYKGPVTEWYVRIKTAMEDNYAYFHEILPRTGQITDIGCGMGQLDIMLSMMCPGRNVLGIDYDAGKIAVTRNCWPVRILPGLHFLHADAAECSLPESDAFVISDMLHYLDYDGQKILVRRCVSRLKEGGIILLRDSDTENVRGQKVTALSELFSTRLLNFNKVSGSLHFLSESGVAQMAEENGLHLEIRSNDRTTSNTFYILRKYETETDGAMQKVD